MHLSAVDAFNKQFEKEHYKYSCFVLSQEDAVKGEYWKYAIFKESLKTVNSASHLSLEDPAEFRYIFLLANQAYKNKSKPYEALEQDAEAAPIQRQRIV